MWDESCSWPRKPNLVRRREEVCDGLAAASLDRFSEMLLQRRGSVHSFKRQRSKNDFGETKALGNALSLPLEQQFDVKTAKYVFILQWALF